MNSQSDDSILVSISKKPFDIFTLHLNNAVIIGKKTPARLYPEKDSIRKKCCMIENTMILGWLKNVTRVGDNYQINFTPTDTLENKTIFNQIDLLTNLSYPLLRYVEGKETKQSYEYWEKQAVNPKQLDKDEEEIRRAVIAHLVKFLNPGHVVYDPACSTGTFLSSIKEAFPEVITIGQDINAQMIEIAKSKVDQVFLGDSSNPACAPDSVDVVICRHLNLDVVTSKEAKLLFTKISKILKLEGIMIVIGHTPILLQCDWMENQGFKVLNRTARSSEGHAIFQLYILQKA
jgi:isonocardicin synthase